MPGKFEIKRATDREYFFNLLAPNGEVILTSEMYKSKTGAKTGVAAVQTNAGDPDRYDRRIDKRKHHYFVLKAANHRAFSASMQLRRFSSLAVGAEFLRAGQASGLQEF